MIAADCHVHLFDPKCFPYSAQRSYTPGAARLDELDAFHESLAISHTVVVQPTVYGTDNACMLAAIARVGLVRARGVAVVDMVRVTDDHLQRLHAGGVRGLRLNLHQNSNLPASEIAQQLHAAQRLAYMPSWHVQVFATLSVHAQFLTHYQSLGVPVVLDHFAGGATQDALDQTQLAMILNAMRTHPIYVKLSAAYRLPIGADASALARKFYEANPQQVVWGSDWPHTGGAGSVLRDGTTIQPFRNVDSRVALAQTLAAIGGAEARQNLLVNNPTHLYDFDHST